jgi:hypothetical protein
MPWRTAKTATDAGPSAFTLFPAPLIRMKGYGILLAAANKAEHRHGT